MPDLLVVIILVEVMVCALGSVLLFMEDYLAFLYYFIVMNVLFGCSVGLVLMLT